MEHCVYWAHLVGQNISDDGYVGVTNNIERRWKEHITKLSCPHFGNAITKYGDAIIWEIVFTGTGEECYEKEFMYRPSPGIGWNIAQGGNTSNNLNRTLSEETKDKLRISKLGGTPWNKGKTGVYSEDTLAAIGAATKKRTQGENNPMFNKTHTEEARAKISAAHKGKEGLKGPDNPAAKKVKCLSTGEVFDTITIAAKSVSLSIQSLSSHLRGKTKSCGGMQWQYCD